MVIGTYGSYWNSYLPMFFDRMSALMKKKMTEVVQSEGITSAHAIYLIALRLQDGQTMAEISHFLDLDQANTHRVMKVLSEKKLVYDDRMTPTSKKFSIMLTQKGKDLADRVMQSTEEYLDNCFKDVSDDELFQVRNTLIKVLMRMDPDLNAYMNSPKWKNPFFVYLAFMPPEEEADYYGMVESRLLHERKKHKTE
ncbi:MAG: winged helix-turn-helix transcriptional regulator [Thermoplasmata archaeon]|nr:winged helix-turn-helix transcriptional regulator [Thermoplasmata archaeon]